MGEINNENTKTANQSWRKRPRKFAPKSRLGCKTCKIRRVKCDLARPSCSKCQSTGRTCDGYSEMPVASNTGVESSHHHNEKTNRAERHNTSMYQPNQWQSNGCGLDLQNLGPLMVLPVTGSAQTEAISFFEYISIKHLNKYHPCESWRNSLMFFSQTVPAVRHAAIALALNQRNYLDFHSGDPVHQPQSLTDCLPDSSPLFHYNRAIQLLLNQENDDSTEIAAITLMVCYLFTCFDQLASNYIQSMKHLRGGVELSRNIDKAILNNNSTYLDEKFSRAGTLICQVTRQIRRLDLQAGTFLVDWTPVDIHETSVSKSLSFQGAFRSLEQAADSLQVLVARVMSLRNTEQQMFLTGKMPPSPSSLRDSLIWQLEKWSSLFENMIRQGCFYEVEPGTQPLMSLLRLQHIIIWTLLSSYGPGREMEYDKFLLQFQQCVALADEVAAAHERYSGSKPTFTPELGILPVLYIIGAKCRHPGVRREVLSVLRRQTAREAVWDSRITARVVERIIEIEEAGLEQGEMIQSMGQIAMWQRIETVTWVHVVSEQSAPSVELSYTFCGQEVMHSESLMINL